jgi:hypothetical protein
MNSGQSSCSARRHSSRSARSNKEQARSCPTGSLSLCAKTVPPASSNAAISGSTAIDFLHCCVLIHHPAKRHGSHRPSGTAGVGVEVTGVPGANGRGASPTTVPAGSFSTNLGFHGPEINIRAITAITTKAAIIGQLILLISTSSARPAFQPAPAGKVPILAPAIRLPRVSVGRPSMPKVRILKPGLPVNLCPDCVAYA